MNFWMIFRAFECALNFSFITKKNIFVQLILEILPLPNISEKDQPFKKSS